MASPSLLVQPLITGERMDVSEFENRWNLLPDLKQAELIDGVVFVPSPVGTAHGWFDTPMIGLLNNYARVTPGCRAGNNSSWRMLGSMPQPDAYLMILPEYGGQAIPGTPYFSGAPELVAEVCQTSTEVDFGPKKALYQRAGVREYVTVEGFTERVVWRVLTGGSYEELPRDPDGVFRSRVFPGLWLDPDSLWTHDGARMAEVEQLALASAQHTAFVAELRRRYK